MNLKKHLAVALSLMVLSFSCSNDDDNTQPEPKGTYENGIFVINQGNFGQGNGSVSFISNDFSLSENSIFSNVNKKPLGDTAQSMAFYGDFAYIVVNYSQKIEVVNRYTFQSVATIDSGLDNPRYMTISNGKGYVTNWGDFTPSDDDFIAVIDLDLNKVISTISCSYLPEEIVSKGNKVYVATGIFGYGNKVDVINSSTDELEESLFVGNSPNSLQFDSNDNLWVLSSESLVKIGVSTNTVLQTIEFEEHISSPSHLAFDNGNLYIYDRGSVYKMNETSTGFPSKPEFSDVNFNYMTVNNGVLYGVDAGNYTANGTLQSFDLTTNLEKHSTDVGLIPGAIYFTAQ